MNATRRIVQATTLLLISLLAAWSEIGRERAGPAVSRSVRPAYRLVAVHPEWFPEAVPQSIAPNGDVVGNSRLPIAQGFLFSDRAGFSILPVRSADVITESGSIFGVLGTDTAYRLDPCSAPQSLFTGATTVTGATDSGIVTAWSELNQARAYFWTQTSGRIYIGTNNVWRSWAMAVNQNGVVVGWHSTWPATWNDRAFRWTVNGGIVDLGSLPTHPRSGARDINDHDEICGHSSDASGGFIRAVRFDGPAVRDLYFGSAWGINDHGHVVGQSNFGAGGPALWTETTGLVHLEQVVDPASSAGWRLTGARDINDHGQIIGWGRFGREGALAAFRLDPLWTIRYGDGCAGRDGRTPILAGEGVPNVGEPFTLVATDATPSAPSVLLFGCSPAATPLIGGCSLLVAEPLAVTETVDSTGRLRHTCQIPPTASGVVFAQLVQIDLQAPSGLLATSNGLELRVD